MGPFGNLTEAVISVGYAFRNVRRSPICNILFLSFLEILFEISHRFDLSEENRQSDTTGEIYRLLPTFSYDTHRLTPSRFDTISLSVIVHLSTIDEIWLTCLT